MTRQLVASTARPKPRYRAVISGKTRIFNTEMTKFNALVAECGRLREAGSSTETFFNDAYGQIVGMGRSAIPFLLRELQRQSGHWVTALTLITGVDLATPQTVGDMRKLRSAWLKWGIANGYLNGIGERPMVRRKPQEPAGARM